MAGSLSGQAASGRCTGAVPPLILVGPGVMAPVLDGVAHTGTAAAESALRAWQFTTRVAARTGEWMATQRLPVAWAALDDAVCAAPLSGGRKAAAAVGHGAAHLLLLVADARNLPGTRAVQRTRGRGRGARCHSGTGEMDNEH